MIAHFRVTAKIGEGGMGEVYEARDENLGRPVALKVLPPELTRNEERVGRFEREARSASALSHPHIVVVHEIGQAEVRPPDYATEDPAAEPASVHFIAMERVEGKTLRYHLEREGTRLEHLLRWLSQVAGALAAAHAAGIVHRDLKPDNVMVSREGYAKVLDFGLAKLVERAGLTASQAATDVATAEGAVLGTLGYMSPEQLRGEEVDPRSDVFSFGCLLYEAVTRRRAFSGETGIDVMHRILHDPPPQVREFNPRAPLPLRRMIGRCLEKEPDQRYHSMSDLAFELAGLVEQWRLQSLDGAVRNGDLGLRIEPPRRTARAVPWGVAALMAVVAAWSVFWVGRERPAAGGPPAHLQIVLPEGLRLAVDTGHPTLALSPDGSRLVFVAEDGSGARRLYVRKLASEGLRTIDGSLGAASPFFSPDGKWIGFFTGSRLVKVPSASGAPAVVSTATPVSVNRGATWISDDEILFAPSVNSGLTLGPSHDERQGSTTEWTLATVEAAPFSWPHALPDGRGALFTDDTDDLLDTARVALLSLETRHVTALGMAGTNPRYSSTGHVLYGRGGSLYAIVFDLERSEATGTEVQIVDGVLADSSGAVHYAVGGNGTLAYACGPRPAANWELAWIDRSGETETLLDSDRPLFGPRLSPDGKRVALTVVDGSNLDVWLFDLKRRALTRRLTTHPGEDFGPVWHPDGQQLAIATEIGEDSKNPGPEMALIREFGAAPEPLIHTPGSGNWDFPSSWSPDRRWLLFVATRNMANDVLMVSPDKPEAPSALLKTPANEFAATVSPDGRWLAYVSNHTGRDEVYVASFPDPGDPTPISTRGGIEPQWARSGRELFYLQGDRFMLVSIDGSGERLVAGEPEPVLDARVDEWSAFGAKSASYDVSLDGNRFLVARRKNPVDTTVIEVVLNWPQAHLLAAKPVADW